MDSPPFVCPEAEIDPSGIPPEIDTDPAVAAVAGFSLRKCRLLEGFLPRTRLRRISGARQARSGEAVVVWASSPEATALAARPDIRVLRVEDGFLRSVGLGARLARPLSWVIDRRGIHYDPSGPSDLEHLLQTRAFEPALIGRAARLRQRIVASRVSKYNLANARWPGLSEASWGRPVVLVAGQVETDASLQAGSGAVRSNIALLKAARSRHPGAWLVYKPHPDVVAGLRTAGAGEDGSVAVADEVVTDAPIESLIDLADAVHVMTSLTGFEALLRGKTVHCHGLPFYAGWGLTTDAMTCPRRQRRLDLDELVAATLILYPRYVSLATGQPCTPEQTLEELIAWRHRDSGGLRWWHRVLKPILRHA